VKRTLIGLIALGGLAFAALACSTETSVVMPDQQAPGVSVTGEGSAFGEPDVAVVTLGVEAQADSVGVARDQAATSMDAMLGALKDGGVEEKDIQTARFSVQPLYDFTDGRQILRGFAVSNIVTAKIREIDATGDLLDAAIIAGGDLARVDSLQFTIDDPSQLEEQARVEAMGDARSKAEALAQAGGVDLGEPRSISEGGGAVPVTFEGAGAFQAADEARTPIELGELEVRVNVQVVYGLE
jgi:uncharacterized protein YggE